MTILRADDRSDRKGRRWFAGQLRVGLETKSILVLAAVVIGISLSAGWFYYSSFRGWLLERDQQEAMRIGRSIELAARPQLRGRNGDDLRELAQEFIGRSNTCFVAILDARGNVVGLASQDKHRRQWQGLLSLPASVSRTHRVDDYVLTHARPIVVVDPGRQGGARVVGAVRVVLDTSETAARLAAVQKRTNVIAAALVLCAMPLGYLLVWRVLIQPIQSLASAARRLGAGDFSVRTKMKRKDELGDLSLAFDWMAEEVARSRDLLLETNQHLEEKVAERTAELRSTNMRLREEMAEKEDFCRAVSHDLNTPLRNIAGLAMMTIMKWRDEMPEEVLTRLQRIQTNVDAGTSLICELLELSRIRTRPQRRRDVDFGELLADLARSFEFELEERHITLEIDPSMPTLHVEKVRMRQLFQNLIDNAMKYMHRERGGRIEIGCKRLDRVWQFHVADNGPGIPLDQQKKIFSIFCRVLDASVAEVDGKGVGLAVVKSVAANYNGRAWVESEPGHGATFYFTLDVAGVAQPQTPAPAMAT